MSPESRPKGGSAAANSIQRKRATNPRPQGRRRQVAVSVPSSAVEAVTTVLVPTNASQSFSPPMRRTTVEPVMHS
jgi:hypothetical protein